MARGRKVGDAVIGGAIVLLLVSAAISLAVEFVKANAGPLIVLVTVAGGAIAVGFLGRGVIRRLSDHRQRREFERRQHTLQLEATRVREARLEAARQRYDDLRTKYGDEKVARDILAGEIWREMTREQLIDSWGSPAAVDTKVMKRKTRETFKYDQTGKNRFGRRAMVENDRVVGWEKK